jgi:hypothetical protein
MRTWLSVLTILALIATASVALAEDKEDKAAQKKQEIDAVAKEALNELFEASSNARTLHEKAYGYAVFDNLKIQFLVSGGGGAGVAVDKQAGSRTYMKMGTGGIGLGLGGQKYQVVFLFEDKKIFDNFDLGPGRRGNRRCRRRRELLGRDGRVPDVGQGPHGQRRHHGHQVLEEQEAQQLGPETGGASGPAFV